MIPTTLKKLILLAPIAILLAINLLANGNA